MKKTFLRIIFTVQMMLLPIFTASIFADPPGPPSPGGDPNPHAGGTGLPVGGPIDDGLGLLLALGIAYGAYRFYDIWKSKKAISKKETMNIQKAVGVLILILFWHINILVG
ncbi:MAG: hypothetical protein NTU98_11975 [Bacteroidetes bacterium]|nr:hypothetical protein [Bacteroidota bacterium]